MGSTNNIQHVPSWTGFYYQLKSEVSNDDHHTVTCLPTINQPAIEMSAIMELLKQVYGRSKRLNIPCLDLVLGHAIYAKGWQILSHPANHHLQKSINMRMGGFHTACIFIEVIGKRFAEGVLKDMIVEADLLGSVTADKVWNGRHYNYGMQELKYIYEAL